MDRRTAHSLGFQRIDEEGVEAAPAAEGDKAPRGRVRKPKADGEETTERAPRKRSLQPRIDTSLNTALYVANLPFKVKSADLHEIFKDFKVKQAYVVTKFGRSKGFGFVELESTAERDRVLTEVTGAVVNDREIVIKPAMPKPASEEVAA